MLKKILKILGIVFVVMIVALGFLRYLLNDQITVMNAVIDEDKDTLAYYIDEKGFNPNDLYAWFNLHDLYLVVYKKESKPEFVKYMLDKGIDPNYKQRKIATPLTYSFLLDNLEIVKLYIENGADLNVINYKNMNPLGVALVFSNCEIAKILIDKGLSLQAGKSQDLMEYRLEKCKNNKWVSSDNKIILE
ncbi:MAG: ankyrin repeat domain-containing protein [Alphaproteobacteria bacterium]|nr:ankyrin repeat domain-containing protein [Alphaproteobacteria bacterium]